MLILVSQTNARTKLPLCYLTGIKNKVILKTFLDLIKMSLKKAWMISLSETSLKMYDYFN